MRGPCHVRQAHTFCGICFEGGEAVPIPQEVCTCSLEPSLACPTGALQGEVDSIAASALTPPLTPDGVLYPHHEECRQASASNNQVQIQAYLVVSA